MREQLMKKIVAYLDPKFEKYRKKKPVFYTPTSLEDFIAVLRRTPRTVLSDSDRARIAAVMGFESRRVRDLMVPEKQMVYVYKKDFLGPLMLDKLYKSGFVYFPVVDSDKHVLGVIHTESLNALEIRTTDRAEKYLNKNVKYLNMDDTLEFAVSEIERTGENYFLVLDDKGKLAGFLNLELIFKYLLGD